MPPGRIVYAVLGAALFLSAVALGNDLMTPDDAVDTGLDGVGYTHYLPSQTLSGTIGIGLIFKMNSSSAVVRCDIQTNTGENYPLFPRQESTPSGIIQPFQSITDGDCGMLIVSPTIGDEGRWIIRSISNSTGARIVTVQPFQVQLERQAEDGEEEEHHDGVGHTHYLPSQTLNGTKGIGLLFEMNSPTGVIRCEVENNSGVNFALFPREEDTPSGIIQPSQSIRNGDCGMLIVTPTIDDVGRWTIRAITNSNGARIVTVQSFQVQLERREEDNEEDDHNVGHTHYLPSQTLNGTKGIGLLFGMNSPTGVIRCEVETNLGVNFALFPREEDTPSGIIQPSQSIRDGDCGMLIITPTLADVGRWTIRAITNSNGARIVTVQPFEVQLERREENSEEEDQNVGHTHYLPSQALNGTKGIGLLFEMNSPTGVVRCEVQTNTGVNFALFPREEDTPSGIIQPSQSIRDGDCGMLIITPTLADVGRWTIRAITNSSGVTIVTVQPFQVQLERREEDSEEEDHNVGHTHYLPSQALNGTKGIGLLFEMNSPTGVIRCEVETNSGVNFALFPREEDTPSGIIQPSQSIRDGDCGMLIITPTLADVGRWTIRAITNSSGVTIVTVQPFQVQLERREEDSEEEDHNVGHTHYLPSQALNGTKGIGLLFEMNSPTGVIRCEVETNSGVNFALFPREEDTPSGIIQPSQSIRDGDCGMLIITPTLADVGRWTIRAITNSSGVTIVTVQPFQVQLERREEDSEEEDHNVGHTHYLPSQALNGTKGIGLLFEMNSPTGVIRCEVETNSGVNFALFPREEDTPSGIIQPSQSIRDGDCGMLIITPTLADVGRWTIRAITNSSGVTIVTVQPFQVQLERREEDSEEEDHNVGHTHYLPSQALNGTKGIGLLFEMNSPTGVVRCEVQTNTGVNFALFPREEDTPSGIIQPSQSIRDGDCGMLIVTPTLADEGRWTIRAITNSSGARIVTVQPFQVQLERREEDHDSEEDDHNVGHTHYLPTETVRGTIGMELHFRMNFTTGVVRCEVQTNTGVNFALFPRDEGTPSGIIQPTQSILNGDCGMLIVSPTIGDEGGWTIRAITNSSGARVVTVRPFQVYLEPQAGYELVDVFPSRAINIFSGNSISLRLRNRYDNLIGCIATSPNGEKFDVLNNAATSNIRAFDQCGVTVRVDDEHSGVWRLDATVGNPEIESPIYFGNFVVHVQNLNALQTQPSVIHVQRSAPASITFGPSEAVSCQLRNPRGDYSPLSSGRCHAEIPIVTDVHEGYWTAFYSLHGKMNVVEETTRVVAYDDRAFNATVTTSDDGKVDLLCRVRAYSFSFCQFVSPYGVVLNIFEGIGNDRYLYHGEGFQSTSMLTEKPRECGITILNPDDSDYGNWKCILKTNSGLTGSILSVPAPGHNSRRQISVSPEPEHNVYVVKDDSFTVKCEVNAELRYCWVGSPNGTTYSVSSTVSSPTTLRYSGMGLALGECGAVIPAAEFTDEGPWRCGMGISNGQEVMSIVPVRVSDTILMPVARNVTIRRNRSLHLSCSLIPAHQESINYCRWIQPNGFGLQQWNNVEGPQNGERNMLHSTQTHCYLDITNMREIQSILGEWTCVAGLVGSGVEVSASIEVIREPGHNSEFPSWGYHLIFIAAALVIAVVAVAVYRAKDRLRSRRDLPPQYEVEKDYGLPPVITEKETP